MAFLSGLRGGQVSKQCVEVLPSDPEPIELLKQFAVNHGMCVKKTANVGVGCVCIYIH